MKKVNIPKEFLYQEYIVNRKPSRQIAKERGVTHVTILNRLKENNFPRRTISEATTKYHFKKEYLEELYVEKGMGMATVAKELGVGVNTILRYLKEYNIPRRKANTSIEAREKYRKLMKERWKDPKYQKKYSTSQKKYNISQIGFDINTKKEEIIDLYLNGKYTLEEIGDKFGVNRGTIRTYLKKWGKKIRPSFFGYNERLKCDDGHLVISSNEREIDNFLFHNGIIHQYEKHIGETNFKCDFYIPSINVYIEYFGLCGIASYDKKTEEKLKIYERFGLNLIQIYPEDNIHDKLKLLIPLCAEKQQTLQTYYL